MPKALEELRMGLKALEELRIGLLCSLVPVDLYRIFLFHKSGRNDMTSPR